MIRYKITLWFHLVIFYCHNCHYILFGQQRHPTHLWVLINERRPDLVCSRMEIFILQGVIRATRDREKIEEFLKRKTQKWLY